MVMSNNLGIVQVCSNPGRLNVPANKFYTVVPNVFRIIMVFVCRLRYKNVCEFTCTNHREPDNSGMHWSL